MNFLQMVFVIWQLATQKKDFIPRIGSQLVGIHTTPDHSIYAVSCADNAIKLISTRSRNLLVSIEGIKYGT
jgi:NET1-associated nuclear protein 1 (U3 small nucleolar RNA-associated protein 17)